MWLVFRIISRTTVTVWSIHGKAFGARSCMWPLWRRPGSAQCLFWPVWHWAEQPITCQDCSLTGSTVVHFWEEQQAEGTGEALDAVETCRRIQLWEDMVEKMLRRRQLRVRVEIASCKEVTHIGLGMPRGLGILAVGDLCQGKGTPKELQPLEDTH